MLITLKIVLFTIASAGILLVSRDSLSIHMHGLYRFLAWEAVLALMLLNVEHVADGPKNARGIISYVLLGMSLALAVHGFLMLHRVGKPDGRRKDPSLFWVEKTTVLVAVGAYGYIRHPLYCAFLFLTWSVFLIAPSFSGWVLALFATLNLIVASKVEERENIHFFGEIYCDYMKRTKMFIPFLI